MYLAIDVGGTKTLVGVFNNSGELTQKERFETPKSYSDFLSTIESHLNKLEVQARAAGIGIPGRIDREKGEGLTFGNLKWKNTPIQKDLQRIAKCPVNVENDAKLAALSEAILIKYEFNKVLYVTLGTGIGIAYVSNGVIDTGFGDRGGKQLLLEFDGEEKPWESMVSGRAIVERFGQKASDIEDDKIWEQIASDLAVGLIDLIALVETDVVVFGGGVGVYFDKFGKHLKDKLKNNHANLPVPALRSASRPEEAVLYGGLELAKRNHG